MLQQRIKEQNVAAYLTIMSIIQGVALSFFTLIVADQYQALSNSTWILVVCTFLVIIFTWFEYIMGISAFVWLHGLLDSIIPFSLFVGEAMLIHTMTSSSGSWYFSMSIFCLIGLVAFINMYYKSSLEPENKDLLKWLGNWKWMTILYIALSLIAFVLGWKYWSTNASPYYASIALFLIVVFLLRSKFYWSKILRYAKEHA
ncbi:hypothetical protein A3194_19140 [Candidatus Thiodiazotropha endoloripes]|uniref:hypothetical protein n=1 Tax=Candidatus Thiodiazotropha endoloripes TaxID=1818881 RepID=UPI00083CE1FD|nr:hypothetical protein [Candidatus Thiodiazotropha endoloripes]ODB82372.1 hypothetical protein A3194_19140 [Candidatus Thiodiazotropha endoloripes]